LGGTLHLDVMDGVFVNNTTWAPPERMHEILAGIPYEAHLMVANPEHAVPVWVAAGAKRVIYHRESTQHDRFIIDSIADGPNNRHLSIAINPTTSVASISKYLNDLESVLVMAVTPGWSGQALDADVIDKVRELKRINPSLRVGVDGGVKVENVRSLKEAGADFVVATSALTDASDPQAALAALKAQLR
jgi:ribulose-phosphate 3-epimerase